MRARIIAVALAGASLCASAHIALSASCKPSHPLPTVVLKDRGICDFNLDSLAYRGTPQEQAKCLMRGEDETRNLGPPLENLPDALASRVGRDTGLPSRETLSSYLSKQDLETDFAANLWQPVSRAEDNNPEAPPANYFVIHDTSGPNYGHRAFPDDIDSTASLNNLNNFVCSDGWGKAHVVVNRSGEMLLDHDFATPWRETKFERAVDFVGTLKGLFLHVEMIQPRRSAPGHSRRNDAQPPNPAFTTVTTTRWVSMPRALAAASLCSSKNCAVLKRRRRRASNFLSNDAAPTPEFESLLPGRIDPCHAGRGARRHAGDEGAEGRTGRCRQERSECSAGKFRHTR